MPVTQDDVVKTLGSLIKELDNEIPDLLYRRTLRQKLKDQLDSKPNLEQHILIAANEFAYA